MGLLFIPTSNEPGMAALEEEILTLCAHINAATYRVLELIREFDEHRAWAGAGICSCAHWLTWRCGIGVVAAREKVRVAHAAETVRRLACDASLVALIEDADGRALNVGRKTRTVPIAIQRALRARDEMCCFPGCTHRRWLESHHLEHWAYGGETALYNLLSLCRFHHRLVHEGGFSIEMLNVAEGLDIDYLTGQCLWEGYRPDYCTAVGVLQALDDILPDYCGARRH